MSGQRDGIRPAALAPRHPEAPAAAEGDSVLRRWRWLQTLADTLGQAEGTEATVAAIRKGEAVPRHIQTEEGIFDQTQVTAEVVRDRRY